MALTNGGISRVRSEISKIEVSKNRIEELVSELSNLLLSNENYNKYVKGTENGNRCNEKVVTLLNLVSRSNVDTDNLIVSTRNYLSRQEEENAKKVQLDTGPAPVGKPSGLNDISHSAM